MPEIKEREGWHRSDPGVYRPSFHLRELQAGVSSFIPSGRLTWLERRCAAEHQRRDWTARRKKGKEKKKKKKKKKSTELLMDAQKADVYGHDKDKNRKAKKNKKRKRIKKQERVGERPDAEGGLKEPLQHPRDQEGERLRKKKRKKKQPKTLSLPEEEGLQLPDGKLRENGRDSDGQTTLDVDTVEKIGVTVDAFTLASIPRWFGEEELEEKEGNEDSSSTRPGAKKANTKSEAKTDLARNTVFTAVTASQVIQPDKSHKKKKKKKKKQKKKPPTEMLLESGAVRLVGGVEVKEGDSVLVCESCDEEFIFAAAIKSYHEEKGWSVHSLVFFSLCPSLSL